MFMHSIRPPSTFVTKCSCVPNPGSTKEALRCTPGMIWRRKFCIRADYSCECTWYNSNDGDTVWEGCALPLRQEQKRLRHPLQDKSCLRELCAQSQDQRQIEASGIEKEASERCHLQRHREPLWVFMLCSDYTARNETWTHHLRNPTNTWFLAYRQQIQDLFDKKNINDVNDLYGSSEP